EVEQLDVPGDLECSRSDGDLGATGGLSGSEECFCGPEEAKRFFSRTPNAAGKKAESWKATKKQPRTRISCKHGNGSGALSDRPDRKSTERGTLCKERTFNRLIVNQSTEVKSTQ